MSANPNRTNLAYDLSLFDDSLSSARAKEPQALKKPESAPRAGKSSAAAAFFDIVFLIILAALFSAIIFSYVQLNEMTAETTELNSEIKAAEGVNEQLTVALKSKFDLDKVEDYATNVLGMIKVDASQVSYLRVSGSDTVQILGKSDGKSVRDLLSGFVRNFNILLEYLK